MKLFTVTDETGTTIHTTSELAEADYFGCLKSIGWNGEICSLDEFLESMPTNCGEFVVIQEHEVEI